MSYALPLQLRRRAMALGATPSVPALSVLTNQPEPRLPDGREPYTTSSFGPRSGGVYSVHYGNDRLYKIAGEPPKKPWSDGKWAVPDAAIGLAVPNLAAGPGVVRDASWTGTGYRVRIAHPHDWYTSYMHLSKMLVGKGDRVDGGQPIGIIGYSPWVRSGCRATPGNPCKVGLNHTHFQLEHGTTGNSGAVDPEQHLGRHLRNLPLLDMPDSGIFLTLALTGFVAWGAYRLLR